MMPFCNSFGTYAIVMALYGFMTSFLVLKTIVLVNLFGLDNLTSGKDILKELRTAILYTENQIFWVLTSYFDSKTTL